MPQTFIALTGGCLFLFTHPVTISVQFVIRPSNWPQRNPISLNIHAHEINNIGITIVVPKRGDIFNCIVWDELFEDCLCDPFLAKRNRGASRK